MRPIEHSDIDAVKNGNHAASYISTRFGVATPAQVQSMIDHGRAWIEAEAAKIKASGKSGRAVDLLLNTARLAWHAAK